MVSAYRTIATHSRRPMLPLRFTDEPFQQTVGAHFPYSRFDNRIGLRPSSTLSLPTGTPYQPVKPLLTPKIPSRSPRLSSTRRHTTARSRIGPSAPICCLRSSRDPTRCLAATPPSLNTTASSTNSDAPFPASLTFARHNADQV